MNEQTRQKILQSTTAPKGIRNFDSKSLKHQLTQLANTVPPPDYDHYMRSKAWQKKRREFLTHYHEVCALCGSKEHLHVHHLHYQTVGHETPEDVIVCCRRCHFIEHLPHNDDPNWASTDTAQHQKPES